MTDIAVTGCPHNLIEQDTACADGMCPLCLADEIKRLDGVIERLNKDGAELAAIIRQQGFENLRLQAEVERLREALQGLIDGVTLEVNEKGGGGFVLARLSDARRALEPKP